MSDHHAAKANGAGVKRSQLKKLVNNYYEKMKKIDVDGKLVNLNRATDAQSVWFSKAAIDKLFADHNCNTQNNDEFGLRVYFAVHETGVLHPDHEIKPEYHNQQTVILVPTRKQGNTPDRDLLIDDTRPRTVDGKGDLSDQGGLGVSGLNHGKLCPSDTDCCCEI